jgi:exopolyphosphatase/guanosine-5'-triphosphate,3'-diphosphate pyrophosphatase
VEARLTEPVFAWQVICLRLAIIKCHARSPVDLTAVQLERRGEEAILSVPSTWEDTHPRTMFLLGEEVKAWERGGPLRLRLHA